MARKGLHRPRDIEWSRFSVIELVHPGDRDKLNSPSALPEPPVDDLGLTEPQVVSSTN